MYILKPMEIFSQIPENTYTVVNLLGLYLGIVTLLSYASFFASGFFSLGMVNISSIYLPSIHLVNQDDITIPILLSIGFSVILLIDLCTEAITSKRHSIKCLKNNRHVIYMIISLSIIICSIVHITTYELNFSNARYFVDGLLAAVLAYVDLANRRIKGC